MSIDNSIVRDNSGCVAKQVWLGMRSLLENESAAIFSGMVEMAPHARYQPVGTSETMCSRERVAALADRGQWRGG
jgi:hypothetical protein